MGNIERICQEPVPRNSEELATSLQKQIIANRVQLKQNPRAPISIQKRICELMKIEKIQQIWENSKLWRVKSPFNFCYANEPINANTYPKNKTTLFLYKQKGEFTGFFHGLINQEGERNSLSAIYVYENGDYFLGDPEKINHGRYIDERSDYQYEGDWSNNYPHGKGTQKTPKGIFQGLFFQGKKHQRGVFKFKAESEQDQMIYDGEFKDDKMTGQGKLYNKKRGYQYIGEFLQGQKHGLGIQKAGNYIYDGHYYQNKRSGSGKLILYKEDTEYQGQFSDDLPNGKGKMKNKGGIVQGVWRDGQMVAILEKLNE